MRKAISLPCRSTNMSSGLAPWLEDDMPLAIWQPAPEGRHAKHMADELQFVRPRCPFFGFHWPERSSDLIDTGTNECGLDLDCHGPCKMAAAHGKVDFFLCDLPARTRYLLEVASRYISFHPAELSRTGVDFEAWRKFTTRD